MGNRAATFKGSGCAARFAIKANGIPDECRDGQHGEYVWEVVFGHAGQPALSNPPDQMGKSDHESNYSVPYRDGPFVHDNLKGFPEKHDCANAAPYYFRQFVLRNLAPVFQSVQSQSTAKYFPKVQALFHFPQFAH